MKNEKQQQRRKNFFVVGKNKASEEALYVCTGLDATELCVRYAIIHLNFTLQ